MVSGEPLPYPLAGRTFNFQALLHSTKT
jgi:hypothetical protein